MSNVPSRETFESMYKGKAPWDIDGPQPAFVDVAERVTGTILDAGCGTGENALFFAEKGHPVLGIDFLKQPIQEARRKAEERGLDAEFIQRDALSLATLDRQFDAVIDSGLFHVFSDEDRARYVAGLAHVTRHGGRVFLLCFSDEEPGTQGPRRVTQEELRGAFAGGWAVDEVRAARFEVRPDLKDIAFSEGGPKAWFSVIRQGGADRNPPGGSEDPPPSTFFPLQQPSLGSFNEQQVPGRALDVFLPVHLDVLGVFILVVQGRVERLGLPGGLQVLGELPGLEDRLDLGDEDRDLRTEIGMRFRRFEEVQELLADEVGEGIRGSELVLDPPARLALLDPAFGEFHVLIDPDGVSRRLIRSGRRWPGCSAR